MALKICLVDVMFNSLLEKLSLIKNVFNYLKENRQNVAKKFILFLIKCLPKISEINFHKDILCDIHYQSKDSKMVKNVETTAASFVHVAQLFDHIWFKCKKSKKIYESC